MQSADGRPISPLYSYYALSILSLLNLLNYIDRFIFSALIPNIKEELHFSDEQIGYIGSAFTIVYTILSPVYGYFADRRARAGLISSGIAIWSIATALAGLAQNYWQMLLARAAVGIGEASYATISPGFLSDYFDRRRRGIAFGIFFTAVPIGQALGYILAGVLAPNEVLGWRKTFFVVGIPGLLMAFAAHLLREPARGKLDEGEEGAEENKGKAAYGATAVDSKPQSVLDGYKALVRNRRYVLASLGYSSMTFTLGALSYWGLELLVSNKNIPKEVASVKMGIFVTLGGLFGTLLGGWIGDLLLRWIKSGYFLLCGVSALLGVAPLVIAITSSNPNVVYLCIFLTVFFLFLGNGPINAIIVNVVAPNLRSTAVATTILAIHFLGDAFSQPMVGIISTWISKQPALPGMLDTLGRIFGLTVKQSLSFALLITPIALFFAAAFFFLGMKETKEAK